MTNKFKQIFPIIFSLTVVAIFYFKRFIVIKYYPPIMNSLIFCIFFISLFTKETVIQKIARLTEGTLNEKIKDYTKKLTYVWCVFLLINLIISIMTIFLSDKIWILYNGIISYILIGLIFVIEYPIRIIYKKRNNL